MLLSTIACFAWWFVAGSIAGWVGYWLIDRLFLRNGESAARLAAAEQAATAAQRDVAHSSEQIAELTRRLDQSVKVANSRTADLTAAHAERDGLQRQLSSAAERLGGLNASDRELHQEIERLHGELRAAQVGAAQSDHELRQLRENLASMTETARVADEQSGGLRRQLAAAAEVAAKGSADLTQQLNTARRSSSDMNAHVASLNAEIENLKRGLAERTNNAATLDVQVAKERDAFSRQAQEIERLKAELAGLPGLQSSLAKLQADLALRDRTATDALKQAADLRGQLDQRKAAGDDATRLERELSTYRSENERIGKELHVAQDWLTRLGTELETERTATQGHVAENARLKTEIGALNTQISQYDRLRKALEAAREAADLGLGAHPKS